MWQLTRQVKFLTLTIKKNLSLIRVIYHGGLKTKDQKVLGSLNPKPHFKISRFCLKLGRNFCWVSGWQRLKMRTCVCHQTKSLEVAFGSFELWISQNQKTNAQILCFPETFTLLLNRPLRSRNFRVSKTRLFKDFFTWKPKIFWNTWRSLKEEVYNLSNLQKTWKMWT